MYYLFSLEICCRGLNVFLFRVVKIYRRIIHVTIVKFLYEQILD